MKHIIRLLKNNAPPNLIDRNAIAGYWAGAYQKDSEGRLVLRNRIILPAIAVTEMASIERRFALGGWLGRDTPYKGQVYEAWIHIDHWAYDTLQRDQLLSWSRDVIWNNMDWLRKRGIINITRIANYARGFDQADRILQSHSHQQTMIVRMIDEYRLRYTRVLEYPSEGIIGKVKVSLNNNSLGNFNIGGTNDPFPYYFDDEFFDMVDEF